MSTTNAASAVIPHAGPAIAPADHVRAAVEEAKIGPDPTDPDVPHLTAPVIVEYVSDLQLLGLL